MTTGPIRVLLVEDDEEDYRLAHDLLAEADGARFSLEWADDYRRGLQAALTGRHDVCLVDFRLNGDSGLDLMREARRSGVRVPMILLTGQGGRSIDLEAQAAGAADYLPKEELTARLLERAIRYALDRARTLERARASEEQYRLLFERNPLPGWVFDRETLGCLAVNQAALHHYGYSRDEFLAGRLSDLEAAGDRARHRTKDGRVIDVEVTCTDLTYGGRPALLMLAADVTERRRADDALRRSEERFRELAEAVHEVFCVMDARTHRLLYANQAYERVFGPLREPADAVPVPWTEHVHPDDRARVLHAVTTAREPATEEFRIVGPDRPPQWIRAHVSPVRDPAGRVVRVIAIMEDITELRRAEEQAYLAQKMEAIGLLAGGVAHDLNNILTAITGEAELLREDLPVGDARREAVQEILKSVGRAAALTRQLLAFSRRQVLDPRVLDLNALVANLDKMLRRVIGEDVSLETVPGAAPGTVRADPGQLEQVVMNLVVNARDAMPDGGKLTIETAAVELDEAYAAAHRPVQPGSYVMLAVSDTGCGMTEEVRSRIFEPFFTTKEQGRGTGLGLATVYGIVKQSGGYIWVYSEPGRGSTFKVYLPRVTDPVDAPPVRSPIRPAPTGSETVLVAEDDDAVRAMARRALERYGYRVLEARNGTEALALCLDGKGVDLLVTDVVMPAMGGAESAHAVRVLRPGMKILYVSGYADRAAAWIHDFPPGCAFLQKPFSPETLARKVREVLDAPAEPGPAD